MQDGQDLPGQKRLGAMKWPTTPLEVNGMNPHHGLQQAETETN